MQVSVNIRRY